jgi:hypothetical protein
LGQTRTRRPRNATSAIPPKADSSRTSPEVRFVPTRDSCTAAYRTLFDHLVGLGEQRGRHGEAEAVSSLHIDHQLELGRLLDRQVRRLCTLEDLVHVDSGAPIQIRKVRSVGHKAAEIDIPLGGIHRRQPVLCRQVRSFCLIGTLIDCVDGKAVTCCNVSVPTRRPSDRPEREVTTRPSIHGLSGFSRAVVYRFYIYQLGFPQSRQQCCSNKPTSVLRVPIGTGRFCVRQSQPQMKWTARALLRPDIEM